MYIKSATQKVIRSERVVFNHKTKKFLVSLKKLLQNYASINRDVNLFAFSRYLGKVIDEEQNYRTQGYVRVGTGLCLHITPGNVPLGFAYSFIWGLISGNSNLVKLPSNLDNSSLLFLDALNALKELDPQSIDWDEHSFFQADHGSDFVKDMNAICDSRVIWGSNETVEVFRKMDTSAFCRDVFFPNRKSICLISISTLIDFSEKDLKLLARRFCTDFESFNQMACSSPTSVFWIEDSKVSIERSQNLIKRFWQMVNNEVRWLDADAPFLGTLRINNIASNLTLESNVDILNFSKITVIESNSEEKLRTIGGYGCFGQIRVKSAIDAFHQNDPSIQTVTHLGIDSAKLLNEILEVGLIAPARLVPIGTALTFEPRWDGLDPICILSKLVRTA